jgi:hypothetical protein
MRLLILGAGYSGKEIAKACRPLFADILGTTRSEAKFPSLSAAGIRPFLHDGETFGEALSAELADVTHLIQSIAPGQGGDRLVADAGSLKSLMPRLVWAGYLSTVGVYGDHDGAWVDEDSPLRPVSARSVERVEAERRWQAAAGTAGVTLAILRLSGIYGPGRNTFVNLANGTARRLIKKDQVFNRIRVEDIGRAAAFLIGRSLGGIQNVTDDEPSPPQDVVAEAARIMGVAVPPDQDFETAELSPMARSFYGENKRVSNARICKLGFEFLYPDYRQSLQQLWESGAWRG